MNWRCFVSACVLAVMPAITFAGNPLGTWHTEPDLKKQTAHVQVTKCGSGYCGTMVRVYDKSGKQISHKNIGKRLFWDARPTGKGDYTGRAYVPVFNKDFPATMTVSGSRLVVKGCNGPICKSQRWTLVR